MQANQCKICDSTDLKIEFHTATCQQCGVLLYYPYPVIAEPETEESIYGLREAWYYNTSHFNHTNFTHMLRYATSDVKPETALKILDYGGGGGQFALVCKSNFPNAEVMLVDYNDHSALPQWQPYSRRIPFLSFPTDETRYDLIFLNDVFEHVEDPVAVLKLLADKLAPNGKIFIDTPRQFWVYPLSKLFSKKLYQKVLTGTVSTAHLQIWSEKSFDMALQRANLGAIKQTTWTEFTQLPDYYLNNMGIHNPILRLGGQLTFQIARFVLKNKIICLLQKKI